jgi:hypothetical protein
MTDETLVREVLHHVTDDLTAPVHRLTETATFRGRRLRRRRRAVKAAGAFAGAVLVGVPLAVTLGGSGSPTGAPVATDPTPVPSAGPTTMPRSAFAPDIREKARWTQMPATHMLPILGDHLLPQGMSLTDAVVKNVDRAPGEPEHVL